MGMILEPKIVCTLLAGIIGQITNAQVKSLSYARSALPPVPAAITIFLILVAQLSRPTLTAAHKLFATSKASLRTFKFTVMRMGGLHLDVVCGEGN